jgi:1-acyl-sn-glycerol-3-phosphate acyltransferase
MIPPQLVVISFTGGKAALFLPRMFHIVSSRFFGIRSVIHGKPIKDRQVLFVGNHLSYLDIPTMGCHFYGSFIAKSDVAGWFLFGLLAKLSRTLFISRNRSHAAWTQEQFSRALHEGRPLVLFAEGTSSNGAQVLPFKSSLFESVLKHEGDHIVIQPFTLRIEEIDGHPVRNDADRDIYAWYGDMELEPHLWNFAKSRGVTISLTFHAPLNRENYESRKALSQACHDVVAGGLDFTS